MLETRRCEACWTCLRVCKNQVFGRINLPFHRHALISHPENCSGCLRCLKACPDRAIHSVDQKESLRSSSLRIIFRRHLRDLLLVTGFALLLSGITIQVGYHMGHRDSTVTTDPPGNHTTTSGRVIDQASSFAGLPYSTWSILHRTLSLVFSAALLCHLVFHRLWYRETLNGRKRIRDHRLVAGLSFLLLPVAFTGFLAWLFTLTGANAARLGLIEIHDKIAMAFGVLMITHGWRKVTGYCFTTFTDRVSSPEVTRSR